MLIDNIAKASQDDSFIKLFATRYSVQVAQIKLMDHLPIDNAQKKPARKLLTDAFMKISSDVFFSDVVKLLILKWLVSYLMSHV